MHKELEDEVAKYYNYDRQIKEQESVASSACDKFHNSKFEDPGFVAGYLHAERSKRLVRKLKHRQQLSLQYIIFLCDLHNIPYEALRDINEPHNHGQS